MSDEAESWGQVFALVEIANLGEEGASFDGRVGFVHLAERAK
jgi:hypothetical protein